MDTARLLLAQAAAAPVSSPDLTTSNGQAFTVEMLTVTIVTFIRYWQIEDMYKIFAFFMSIFTAFSEWAKENNT